MLPQPRMRHHSGVARLQDEMLLEGFLEDAVFAGQGTTRPVCWFPVLVLAGVMPAGG